MKRSGLSMAAMVATVVMVLTVSTYAITARAVNPVVGLSFQGTTAVCHAKCFAGSDSDNIQATLTLYCGANRLDSWDGSGKGTISLSGTCRVETGKQYKLILTYSINGNTKPPVTATSKFPLYAALAAGGSMAFLDFFLAVGARMTFCR